MIGGGEMGLETTLHLARSGKAVISAGMRALTALADSFMGLTDEYAEAGDCVRARNAERAVKEDYTTKCSSLNLSISSFMYLSH
jgi:hypothetical protein